MQKLTPLNLYKFQQRALVSIHLDFEAKLNTLTSKLLAELSYAVSNNGTSLPSAFQNEFNALGMANSIIAIDSFIPKYWVDIKALFIEYIVIALEIVYAAFQYYHNEYFLKSLIPLNTLENKTVVPFASAELQESSNIFINLTAELVQAAMNRIYKDGLNLSDRLWNLNSESLSEIKRIIYDGAINKRTVEEVAKSLQEFLTGKDGNGGIQYAALRLARTEIQTIYHDALRSILGKLPFVKFVQVNLSARHKVWDVCDHNIYAAEKHDGVFPIDAEEAKLPYHPNCLCYLKVILEPLNSITKRIRLWRNGKKVDMPLNEYAKLIGGDLNIKLNDTDIQAIMQWQ